MSIKLDQACINRLSVNVTETPNVNYDFYVNGTAAVSSTVNLASQTASAAVVTDASKNLSTRAILNNTAQGALGWNSAGNTNTDNLRFMTVNTLAYWNGAYSGTSSNLSVLGTVTTGTWNASVIGASYIDTAIARLASPTFTGTPKAPTAADGTNDTQIATTAFVMNAFKANDAMEYKGVINSNDDLPANHTHGWTYRIGTAGEYAGVQCEIGDMIICNTDGTSANSAHWNVIQNNIDGAVISSSNSSTDNAIARWDGTTGRIIKNSTATLDNNGLLTTNAAKLNTFLYFTRSDGPSYIMLPADKGLIINNGNNNGTAYANLSINKTQIFNAYKASLGTKDYPWGSLYSGPLYIGNTDIAENTGYATANSGSNNYIAFYGVNGDNPGNYNHTYIGESIYGPKDSANEKSELLLFHGNDYSTSSGPDRIRLLAGQIEVQVYESALSGSWDTIRATTGTQVANFAKGKLTVNGDVTATTFTGNLTGNATNVTGIVAIANGGTGKNNASEAWTALGGGASGKHADNYFVQVRGNAGQSNMNDIGRLWPSSGMTNLKDPGNNNDNPMNGTTKSTGWHLYWDTSYQDNPNGNNAWVAQIVNKAGTSQWWVRSRSGSTITDGTAWTSNWRHLVTSTEAAIGNATTPVYVNDNGELQECTSYANASVNYANSAGNANSASKLSNTIAIGSNTQPVYFTADGVPQATATEMLRAFTVTDAGTDMDQFYDSGMYSITGGTLTHYPTGGSQYAAFLTVAYRKPSGNTIPDYAWQMGNCTQNTNRLWYRTSTKNSWREWRQFVNIAANTAVGDTDLPIYVNANGEVNVITSLNLAEGGIITGAASTLTGSVTITGTAAHNPLIVRGIAGCSAQGVRDNTEADNQVLYLNYTGGSVQIGQPNTSITTSLNVSGKTTIINNTAATTTLKSSQLVIANRNDNTASSTAVSIELYRQGNASWQIVNEDGKLKFKNNYTTATQNTYLKTSLTLDYNTGDATFSGSVTADSFSGDLTGHASLDLPLTGGTLTGAVNFKNNTWNKVGDDVQIGDINKGGHLGIQGINGNTGIFFTTYNQTTKTNGAALTWNGTDLIADKSVQVPDITVFHNANQNVTLQYNSTDDSLDFIFA